MSTLAVMCPIGEGSIDPNTGAVTKQKVAIDDVYKSFYQYGLQTRADVYMKACDHGTMNELQWLNNLASRTEMKDVTPTRGYNAPIDDVVPKMSFISNTTEYHSNNVEYRYQVPW